MERGDQIVAEPGPQLGGRLANWLPATACGSDARHGHDLRQAAARMLRARREGTTSATHELLSFLDLLAAQCCPGPHPTGSGDGWSCGWIWDAGLGLDARCEDGTCVGRTWMDTTSCPRDAGADDGTRPDADADADTDGVDADADGADAVCHPAVDLGFWGAECTPGTAGTCGSDPRMVCVEFALGNACDIRCADTCDCPVEAPVCHAAPAPGGGDVWVCGT